uniref:Ig-like domain-containing protein n=1 Tax=Romanomermis culicivorax TaxID=13658 RepID=A0A915LEE0_ROMCU
MINDFGFVILEIAPVEPHDSGVYRCVARNFKGTAQSEGKINVQRGGVVSYAWQLPEKAQQDKIVELEDYLHRDKEPPPAAEKQFGPPTIVEPLKDLGEISENSIVHFQCQIEPIDDPNLKVQWFHNGKVLPFSSRIRTQNDFGFVVLDIKQTIPEDSGNYLCRVINKSGQAETVGQLMCK